MEERILALRREMKKRGIFAYLVTTEDFHGSEYVGAFFKSREYLSGFTGSAGTLVVTENEALLWTDGRYFLQAYAELDGSEIKLMKQGEPYVQTIEEYLAEKMPDGSVLGFDGRCVNAVFAKKLETALRGKNIVLEHELDLVGEIWEDRPPLSNQPVFALPEEICGRSRSEKLLKLRGEMCGKGARVLVLSALDEIAWTLNLRGGDIDYNPVFLAFMLVFSDRAELYTEESIFNDEIKKILRDNKVVLFPYESIYTALEALEGAVWIDTRTANFTLRSSLKKAELIAKPSPAALIKARKRPLEISAMKAAHIKDGVAVTRFMKWLKAAVWSETITEITAAEKLEEFRKECEDYLGQSFEPIMAYREHGAIVHYSATEETNAVLEPRGLLLSDTGGHYCGKDAKAASQTGYFQSNSVWGTTDITRTFVLGEITDEEKRAFTLALAAHFELLGAVFPKGARGSTLDAIARKPLWDNGLDFNHGTGHGVGFLLNVHEGPQRISYRAVNDAPLEDGMITSNEPGLYFEGKFGVRHESLAVCEELWGASLPKGFLKFSPLTCVPFDRAGIDTRYLTERQLEQLNNYHKWVFNTLSPMLSNEERDWLAEVTKPLNPYEYKFRESGITIREETEGSGRYYAAFLPEYDKPVLTVPEELGNVKIVGIKFFDLTNPAVVKIRLSRAVEYIQFNWQRFGGRDLELEIADDNPYLKTDGKALYSRKGELLIFYANDCTSYEVLPGTRVIKDGAFWQTPNLRHIKLPQGVEEIRMRAFFKLPELRDINIPDTVLFLGRKAFYGCDNLEALHIPGSVEVIGDRAFPRSTNFRELTVDPQNHCFTVHDGVLYTKDRSMLLFAPLSAVGKTFVVPGFVRTIGAYAFFDYSELEELVLHPRVSAIERSAFENCCSLTKINPENVGYIEDKAFKGCLHMRFSELSCEKVGCNSFDLGLGLDKLTLSGMRSFSGDIPTVRELILRDDIDFSQISDLLFFVMKILTIRSHETGEILYKLNVDIPDEPYDSSFNDCFKPDGIDFERYDSIVEEYYEDSYGEAYYDEEEEDNDLRDGEDEEDDDLWDEEAEADIHIVDTAFLRLKYPIGLSEHARDFYLSYLTKFAEYVVDKAAKRNDLELLRDYFEFGVITEDNAAGLIASATEHHNPEFTAYFLELKNRYFPNSGDK